MIEARVLLGAAHNPLFISVRRFYSSVDSIAEGTDFTTDRWQGHVLKSSEIEVLLGFASHNPLVFWVFPYKGLGSN